MTLKIPQITFKDTVKFVNVDPFIGGNSANQPNKNTFFEDSSESS